MHLLAIRATKDFEIIAGMDEWAVRQCHWKRWTWMPSISRRIVDLYFLQKYFRLAIPSCSAGDHHFSACESGRAPCLRAKHGLFLVPDK